MSEYHSKIVVCVPAFNVAKTISSIVRAAKAHAHEVIVCDDGSSDFTDRKAEEAGAVVIRHAVNKGYGAAIKTLFRAAKARGADVMVTLDSDGQHDPEQISRVTKPILDEGYDIVVGSRFLNDEDKRLVPAYRSLGIKAITKLAQMTCYNNLTDAQSGFRAYSRNAISEIDLTEEGMAVSTEILIRARRKNLMIKEVPISIRYDVERASTRNPVLHGFQILLTIVRFLSIYHPLSFYGVPGVAFLIVAGVYIAWALDLYSASRYVSTNMILVSVGSAVIGVMLLVTSVILYTVSALLKEKNRGS